VNRREAERPHIENDKGIHMTKKFASRMAIPRTMRAAQLTGPRSVEIVEAPVPVPGPGELLVRMEGCGLCGSNLPVWQGRPWFEYPLEPGAPGHEGWGRVVALGGGVDPNATGVQVGDRVAALSQRALAEYDVVSSAAVVVLPRALDGMDVPGEPLGCAMNVFRRSDIRRGHAVAVIGAGFLGAVLIRLASRIGARVFAISRRPFAVALAREMGAEVALSLAHDDVSARIAELTGGRGCDRVIEAVGLQSTLDLASALTCVRGRLIIAGYHQDGPRTIDMQAWNWRGIDVINAHERDTEIYVEGMHAGLDVLTSQVLDLSRLLTHRCSLAEVSHAFELLELRPDGFLKAEVVL
jgi:threonine dehydrogenase-like Zn-dependent dehydrogenase